MTIWTHVHHGATTLLDVLFPPRSEERLVRMMHEHDLSPLYRPAIHNRIHTLSSFNEPYIRALTHEAKFHGNTRAHMLLGSLLAHHIAEHPQLKDAYWIPIPLSPARQKARGYNQTLAILRAAKIIDPTHILTHVLTRTRDTRPQTELDRNARLRNMDHVFALHPDTLCTEMQVVLFDDVTTTGATLKDAYRALATANPASITQIALAH